MKVRSTLIIGAIVAMLTAGASAAYLTVSVPVGASIIVTALKADEGTPQNLVTCDENARKCTSHNLTAVFPSDEGAPLKLIVALKADEGVTQNLVIA